MPSKHAAPAPPAVLVFDTETSGLKDPLAVQIAWVVYDADGRELWSRMEYLALPPGKSIDPGAERVHRISLRTLEEKGKAAQFVLADFYADVDRVAVQDGRVVAHNAKFDARVVTNTATSCGLARGRGIAPDRHGRVDGRGLEHERESVVRRGKSAVVRARVARVTHELRHLLASSRPNRRVAAGP